MTGITGPTKLAKGFVTSEFWTLPLLAVLYVANNKLHLGLSPEMLSDLANLALGYIGVRGAAKVSALWRW